MKNNTKVALSTHKQINYFVFLVEEDFKPFEIVETKFYAIRNAREIDLFVCRLTFAL